MNPVPALVVDVVDAAWFEQAATAQPEMPKITSAPNCFRRRAIDTAEVSQIATFDAPVASHLSAWLRLHGRCCAQFVAFRGPDGVAR